MPFKFAFIGQDIPMHLPFLLVDFLYAGKEDGILAVEEKNAAMRDVLQHYAEAIVYASSRNMSPPRSVYVSSRPAYPSGRSSISCGVMTPALAAFDEPTRLS